MPKLRRDITPDFPLPASLTIGIILGIIVFGIVFYWFYRTHKANNKRREEAARNAELGRAYRKAVERYGPDAPELPPKPPKSTFIVL
jgi:hypothetical protein